ncbi:Protein of unknown function [Pustulibacterium marinum]|uniref:DUF4199 domain-containing protein n=1 Tax=Pustulibacterium marinum TaxID=1224947 RepID=A0A1I7EWC1_9FLAO|nr:DUF4199 domain-containing protein [Pustulibacterium marinum]SFU28212.1 Protein of unknown function [Pustulibacterium marinum]
MEKIKNVSIKYGIITAIAYIVYFLLIRLIGMHENPWFRLFNGIIMFAGLYAAVKEYKSKDSIRMTYYSGFRAALFTGFLSTIIFILFMAIYMYHLDTEFVKNVMDSWFEDYNQGPAIVLFLIFVEGLASSMILTLTIMQKEKKSQNLKQDKKIYQQKV